MDEGNEFHQFLKDDHHLYRKQVKDATISEIRKEVQKIQSDFTKLLKQKNENSQYESISTKKQYDDQPESKWQPQQPKVFQNEEYLGQFDDKFVYGQPNGKISKIMENVPYKMNQIQPILQQFGFDYQYISFLTKGFISKQTYSYQDYELLNQILKSTEMQHHTIHKEQKVIEYNFDRKQFIKLSDLIYWILEGLVLIHNGQLLDLFENILEYIRILEQKNINHEYLDSNRIWLFMDEDSKFPSVVPEIMKYRIILTGYQCPFYEDCSQQNMKASDKIIQILIGIIYLLKSKNCWLVINDDNIDKVKSIYQNIINVEITIKSKFSQNVKIIQFIQLIKGIKQTYNYNIETQMLNFDLNNNQLQFRISKSIKIEEEIKNLFNSFNGQNQLYLENAFQELVPFYVKYLVQNGALPQISNKFLDQFKQKLIEQQKQLQEQNKEFIQQEVIKEILNIEKIFKFDFTIEDIEEINKDILIEFGKAKIKNYFMNSIQFYNNDIKKKNFILFQGIAIDLIKKRIKLSLENKMFKFDIELI